MRPDLWIEIDLIAVFYVNEIINTAISILDQSIWFINKHGYVGRDR